MPLLLTSPVSLSVSIQISPEGVMSVHPLGPPSPASPLRLFDPETERDNRMAHPVVTHLLSPPDPAAGAFDSPKPRRRWVLRSVFQLLLWRRKKDELADASWHDYRSLLRRWEAFWSDKQGHPDRGPDVREITDQHLREFFAAQFTWQSARTWEKNRDLFGGILRTCLVRSEGNKSGPRSEHALLTELPWLEIPPQRFFTQRKAALPEPPARPGGHRPSRDPLLSVEEFSRVVDACQMATFPCWDGCDARGFWRAFFAFEWLHGIRVRNLLRLPWTVVDWDRQMIQFEESKKGNEVWVPIAPALSAALSEIRHGTRASMFPIPQGQIQNLDRNFYPTYKRIWQWAGVPLRMPHQLRATCVSHWKEHNAEFRKFATGHSRGGDVQDAHYVILGEGFRKAVHTFPQPPALLHLD